MDDIEEISNEVRDAREMKRAVSVKMSVQGCSPIQICQVLNVSWQYVSTWKGCMKRAVELCASAEIVCFERSRSARIATSARLSIPVRQHLNRASRLRVSVWKIGPPHPASSKPEVRCQFPQGMARAQQAGHPAERADCRPTPSHWQRQLRHHPFSLLREMRLAA
jgi:hypothetical protein